MRVQPSARPSLRAAPSAPAPELEARQGEAVAAYRNGDLVKAGEICRQVLSLAPEFPPALYLLGLIAVKNGDNARAIAFLLRVVALDENAAKARTELAALLRDEGRNAEAIELLETAVKRNPRDAAALNDLGRSYHLVRNFYAAVDCLREAIRLRPNVPGFHANLGDSWEQLGRSDYAILSFRRAIELGLEIPDVHIQLGRMHRLLGEPKEAAQCFAAARAKAKTVSELLQLARVLSAFGEWDEAESDLRQVIARHPDSAEAYNRLGTTLQLRGRFEEARASFEKAIALKPDYGDAYLGLVSTRKFSPSEQPLLERMQSIVAVRELSERAREYLHYALGKAQADLRNFGEAIKHYDAANAIVGNGLRRAGSALDREGCAAQYGKIIASFTPELFRKWREMGSDTVSPLTSADSRLVTGEKASDPTSSEVPILIVGMIRSGTTLVEQIVSSHPDAAPGGELRFWRRLGHAPKSVAEGTFDKAVANDIAEEYLRLLHNFRGNAKRVTDKTPLNYTMLGLVHLVFPNARIIHCRRNPLDTCLSIYTTPFRSGTEFAHDRGTIVFFYKQYLRLMEHWRRVLPSDRFLEVDYEDLVENPEPVTRRMIAFCGLEWNEACLKPEQNPRAVATPSTWQVRQPMYKISIGRWRDYEPWLGEFRELAGTA